MLSIKEMGEILKEVSFQKYIFEIREGHGGIYLQARYLEADIVTKKEEWQFTRKWLLSPHMTKSELVQTAFKLALTSAEHRTREHFTYKGKRIFGPHFDVEALVSICNEKRLDYRKPPPCPGPEPCNHTDEQHRAFDEGLAAGEAGIDQEDCPYEDYHPAQDWLTGHSVGLLNREDIEE